MSIWNPEPHDPWYEAPEDDYSPPAWQRIVCDTLLLLIAFALVGVFAYAFVHIKAWV